MSCADIIRKSVEIDWDPRVHLVAAANNKPSIADKAANQQYLTRQEEQALLEYVLRLADNAYPLPVKFLRSLALIIITDPGLEVKPPAKNWPQGFYRRHPQLIARRLRAIDWKRDGRQIEDKVRYWFAIIGRELADPQTRDRAGGRPRLLICDGFGTHESLEIMKFCFANRIILRRLPSHTSHKLQPCDAGVFSPLKTAYRAQVEQACRAGVGTIGKPHFTYLYDRARKEAFTHHIIRSAWARSGLFPFNPSRILREFQASQPEIQTTVPVDHPTVSANLCHTPGTSDQFALLCSEVKQDAQSLDSVCKHRLQTLSRAAEKAFAKRAL